MTVLWMHLLAAAFAGETQAPETVLRLGYSHGKLPGYFDAWTLDSEGWPERVASGVFGGDGVYRVPGALWLRLEAQAGQDSIEKNALVRAIATDLGGEEATADAEGSWVEGRATLEAYWESPQIGPVLARVGSRSTADASGWNDVLTNELALNPDLDRDVRTGLGAELGVPLRVGGMEITPTVRGAYLIPVYAGPGSIDEDFAEEWTALDLVGRVQEAGGRVEMAAGPVSLRLSVDATKYLASPYTTAMYEEMGEPLPEREWNLTTTALVGVRFGGGKAEATAETKGASADAAEAAPKLEIVDTGIASIDDVFRPARNILERVEEARNAVRDLRVGVQQAAGLAEGATLQEALTSIAVEFAKGVTVSMDGLRPVFKVKPQAPKQVQDVVKAIDTGVPRLLAAVEELGTVPARVEKLVAAAQALPAKLPADAKAAGISFTEVPKLLKKLKGNLKAVAALPQLAGSALTEVKDTLAALAALAG